MTDKIELRQRWDRLNVIHPHFAWRVIALGALLTALIAIVACGSSHSSVPPAARASAKATASQIITGIKTGQAAKQAEGIVQDCFKHYSGTGLISCILPHARHRALFKTCAYHAFGSDIPGEEVQFVNTDLPGCLVKAR